MSHTTVSVTETVDPTAIVLVGAPASGKTTIRDLFADHGAIGCDLLTESDPDGSFVADDWKQRVTEALAGAAEKRPHVACIEGATSEDHINAIAVKSDQTLVVRVLVPNREQRLSRYHQREVDNGIVVSGEDVVKTETNALYRESKERPYPEHDVTIVNDDNTSTAEISNRCATIVSLLSSVECAGIQKE